MLCALIMAGGKGTRFWPLSTVEKPKQFLKLIGNETMIQMTVNRILPIIPMDRIFVCTGKQYVKLVKEQLPDIPEKNIIVEPEGRNTAPCIALSALYIKRIYKDANMVVLPSDHLIRNEEKFRDIISSAYKFIENNKESIVTLGMKPSRPEVGYGYIRYIKENKEILKVDSFVEKPDRETAIKYLNDGSYLWNGGMFLWSLDGILNKIKTYLPKTYEALNQILDISEQKIQEYINKNYKNTDSISIDYGILEKDNSIFVVPSEIGWDDVGNWNALDRYREKDSNGNILLGETMQIDSLNNILVSKNKKIVVSNIQDIYVLESDDSIIIGKKDEIDNVKRIKESFGL